MSQFTSPDNGEHRALASALSALQHTVPPGFAANALLHFESAFAAKRRKKTVALAATVILISTLSAWALLLDLFGLAGVVWDSLVATTAFMGSIVTIWRQLPYVSVLFSMAMMTLVLLAFALLAKLERLRVPNHTD